MSIVKLNKKKVLFFLLWLILLLFFLTIRPLDIFDTDDWLYAEEARHPWPIWKAYEPTRLVPQVMLSFCTSLARYIIFPICGNITISLRVAYAVFVSAVLVCYFIGLDKELEVGTNHDILVSVIIFLLHFTIYKTSHVFASTSVTNIFFYTLPAIINFLTVMYLERNKDNYSDKVVKLKAFLLIYLTINSNMYASIILVSYVLSSIIIICFNNVIRQKKAIFEMLKSINFLFVFTIILWFGSMFFEYLGGRSKVFNNDNTIGAFFYNVAWVIQKNLSFFKEYSLVFGVVACSIVILYFIMICKHKASGFRTIFKYLLCIVICWTFITLLCSIGGLKYYATRYDVKICTVVYFLMILNYMAKVAVINDHGTIIPLCGILTFVLAAEIMFRINYYPYYNNRNYNAQIVNEINEDIISQIVSGASKRQKSFEVHVPKYDREDNWPIATYGDKRFIKTLYLYGVIDYEPEIIIVPDITINKKYGLE